MDSKDIKTITLRVNSDDAQKKIDDLRRKIEQANTAKERSKALEEQINHEIEQATLEQARLNAQIKGGALSKEEERKALRRVAQITADIAQKEKARAKAKAETTRQLREETKATRQLDRTEGQYRALERTLRNLGKATVPELKNAIRTLERTLASGAVERGTEEWAIFERQIRECRQELKKIDDATKAIDVKDPIEKVSDFGTRWVGIVGMLSMGGQMLDQAVGWVRGLVEEYAQMNEHLADVHKYTSLSADAVRELNESFKQMDTRTSREALNDLAADAGRLGIQSKGQVMEFVEAADMINVALGEDLGEDAVKNIGKLTQLFKVDQTMGLRDGMLATASTINELAQSSSASEPYILEFTARLAGVGYQAGIEQPKLMAFASVLDQGMVGVEKGATALQNILTALMRKPAEMAQVAGLDVKRFTQLLQTDANAALLQFIEAVSRAGRLDAIAPMLDEMQLSGSGATQVMATLANNIDLLRTTQTQATAAFADGTSVVNEFNNANSTTLAEMEKAQKRFRDARIELGEAFQPIAASLMTTSSLTIKLATTIIKVLTDYKGAVMSLAAIWGTYTLYVMRATLAEKAELIIAKARGAWSKIGAALYAIEQVAVNGLKVAYFRLTGQTAAATAAQTALNTAMSANPIGAILTLISLLVIAYNYFMGSLTDAEKAQRSLEDIRTAATQNMEEERTKIELLRRAAMDEKLTLDERKKAVDKLNAIIPNYNAQIDATTGKYIESKKALDDYLVSLQRKYELEGAKEALVDLSKQIVEAEMEENRKRGAWKKQYDSNRKDDWTNLIPFVPQYRMSKEWYKEYEYNDAKSQRERLEAQRNAILNKYGGQLAKQEVKQQDSTVSPTPTGSSSAGKSAVSAHSSKGGDKQSEKLAKAQADIEQAAEVERQASIARYVKGEADLLQHRDALLAIERDALVKKRDLYKEGSADWQRANTDIDQLDRAHAKKRNDWSIENLEREQKAELAALDLRAATTLMKEEDIEQERGEITLSYLRRRADLYRQYGQVEEHAKAEAAYDEESKRQRLEKERKFAEQVKKLRESYAKKSAEEVMLIEIQTLEEARQKGLVDEEAYQKLLRAIRLKYRGIDGRGGEIDKEQEARTSEILEQARPHAAPSEEQESASGNDFGTAALAKSLSDISITQQTYDALKKMRDDDLISQAEYTAAAKKLDKERFDRFAQGAQAAFSTVGALMQSLSAYQQASARAEEAKVTAKYDAEIKAAEGNSEKVKKLEEEKSRALADIKSKANKRAMAIEIAQATAAAAMAALNAYKATIGIPVVDPVMAPIAAGAAAAFGAIQIATIVKQHEAQEVGFYEGGFTGGTRFRRRAGIVHEGEFVANHHAVQNPNVLPVLRLLDHAQRNNTIATLTATDVSRAIAPATTGRTMGSTTTPSTTTLQVLPTEAPETTAAIRQLTELLAQGIEATVAIDGQNGVAHQLKKYNDLKNRK